MDKQDTVAGRSELQTNFRRRGESRPERDKAIIPQQFYCRCEVGDATREMARKSDEVNLPVCENRLQDLIVNKRV